MTNTPHTARSLDDLPDIDALLARSGLEFMQDILAGNISGPPIGATLGFTIATVEQGRVTFAGTPQFAVTNPMRGVHGGWYGAILDSCMACAVMTHVPRGSFYTTLEYKVNLTRAIPLGTDVIAEGLVSHAGRSTAVATGEIRGRDDGRLYASGSTTCMIMVAPGRD
ncbi:PaaI family thioesterase [Roseovarius pelagicus]|uniref:PaaI family thioesterase n=1 Tax=Roseovarius pelagicus TaxID=2980108 RepID=A0ABY6D9C8_9RHOB|nr:PaaI family thioesterase [Roseovarius pelagicus]UXX82726.1 PaaI family thioesterase [Roseovarius pelagicus]